jgi:PBP1b-binding outer membrane lipoprotein LpoB
MKAFFLILVAAGLLLSGCGNNNSGSHTQGTNTSQTTNAERRYDTGNPITAPVDYIGAVGQAQKYAVKQIDLAYLNQAIQLFNTQEGRLPKDLNELVPNYVGKIPEAPYGSKIVYDASSGTVTVVKQ